MSQQNIWMILVVAYIVQSLAERRLSKRNYAYLKRYGVVEHYPRLSQIYYSLGMLCLPLAIFESRQVEGLAAQESSYWLIGLVLGFGLRLWSIYSLGSLWTNRCLAVQGMEKVISGPFRYLKHPEFLGRVIDGTCLFAFIQAYGSASLYFVASLGMVYQLARSESQLLNQKAAV